MALFEIGVRHDQQDEKKQWVDDEEDTEPCISSGEVGDAGRKQSNSETKIGKLLYFERDTRDQQRQQTQYFGGRQLYLEIVR